MTHFDGKAERGSLETQLKEYGKCNKCIITRWTNQAINNVVLPLELWSQHFDGSKNNNNKTDLNSKVVKVCHSKV